MASRETRKETAKETIHILEEGSYKTSPGEVISFSESLEQAKRNTRLFDPDELEDLTVRWSYGTQSPRKDLPAIEVTNESTLSAASRLYQQDPDKDLAALNFASAKNPGGGFLSGASAQEESLSRKSGLYACLKQAPEYYERNKAHGSSLYTDHMIYSPGVPVFRDADDQLLNSPYPCSMITAPAVNAGAVRENEPKRANMIQPIMEQRIEKLIALCVYLQHTRLVLGAWGCGVFRNDPNDIARWFGRYLGSGSPYSPYLRRVVFAVLDGTPDRRIISPFRKQFG